ncbi:hypothetical protein BLA39750_07684 [Burkholderia lata]|uniref:Uncharacterized protein n=1 Tax=Burkholderia lata (strain ATCC 17760 / DSM 23089 / LMG 22485 / NCIMB 9086 / R18194 / 383) TaxID=482957 RepID=A0A6P3C6N4_BURL3|nr:hypothetical protein BLA39750_07684 [Burkholderia lata]
MDTRDTGVSRFPSVLHSQHDRTPDQYRSPDSRLTRSVPGIVRQKEANQPAHADDRITLQKFPAWKCGSLSASTSAFTLPNVVSGLCLIPS